MNRKRLLVLAGVALAAAVIILAVLEVHAYRQKLARSRLIDREHCARIKKGMSHAEVEAILGGPPGDFRTAFVDYWMSPRLPPPDGGRMEDWLGNGGAISVAFDEQGVVRWRGFFEANTLSLAEWVQDWLRRVWP